MWETPSLTPSALQINHEVLQAQNQSNLAEIQRLRTLLEAHGIKWAKETPPQSARTSTRKKLRQASTIPWNRRSSARLNKPLPHLPNEIIVRILGLLVTQPEPIIDPFWKLRPENMTKKERKKAAINIEFLATCRAFKVEGTRLLIANNSLVFTQLEALQNFSNISGVNRSLITDITLRIVGKYYDSKAGKRTLYGDSDYHEDVADPTVYVAARPDGASKDKGVQGYCWQQVLDFMQALVPISTTSKRSLLLPALKTMRLDMVNFSEHLPFIGSTMISILRWHVGQLVDELTLTGFFEDSELGPEDRYMENLVKDEGMFFRSPPAFASVVQSKERQYLRPLPCYDDSLIYRVIRPKFPVKFKQQTHPDGGSAPKSKYPKGATIWKWTTVSLNDPEKTWVEFHRGCGFPVTECGELADEATLSDLGDESDDDEGSWEDSEANEENEDVAKNEPVIDLAVD